MSEFTSHSIVLCGTTPETVRNISLVLEKKFPAAMANYRDEPCRTDAFAEDPEFKDHVYALTLKFTASGTETFGAAQAKAHAMSGYLIERGLENLIVCEDKQPLTPQRGRFVERFIIR